MSPQPDFAAARRAMIDSQLRPQGVTDAAVLAAMASIPRERFVPEAVRPLAYSDRPLDLGDGKALMAPAALGKLITELEPRPGERALIVGPGAYAAKVLETLGLEVDVADTPHSAGKTIYDLILIDGAVEDVPAGLVEGPVRHARSRVDDHDELRCPLPHQSPGAGAVAGTHSRLSAVRVDTARESPADHPGCVATSRRHRARASRDWDDLGLYRTDGWWLQGPCRWQQSQRR